MGTPILESDSDVMTKKNIDYTSPKQYVLRFLIVPALLTIVVWYLTGPDFGCVTILVTLALIFNALYWLLRLIVFFAPSIRRRLELPQREVEETKDS